MIKDILQKKNVQILDGVSDWKEAIYKSTKQLIEQGYITPKYPETIIDITEKHGAYYVLSPHVALIHARPQDGVIKKQLAVILLRRPVLFKGKSTPTELLITLAAEDTNSHLDVLQQLGDLFSDDDRFNELLNSKDADTLYELITKE